MDRNGGRIDRARLDALMPTQITVGMLEVTAKRRAWRGMRKRERRDFLESHCVPSVRGPDGLEYIVDHHHLCRALLEEDARHVWLMPLADLSALAPDEFWIVMDHRQWVHPYDADGRRRDYDALPGRLDRLVDDPYRGLAGLVRQAGGFAKSPLPYAEFLWADFYRRRIDPERARDPGRRTLEEAVALARTRAARHLPGWIDTGADEAERER